MANRKLSREQIEEIALQRETGVKTRILAKRFGVSIGLISWHCLCEAADPPDHPYKSWTDIKGPAVMARGNHILRRFTKEEDEILLAMSVAGESNCAIGRRLNRKPNSIKGRLHTLARRDMRMEQGRQ